MRKLPRCMLWPLAAGAALLGGAAAWPVQAAGQGEISTTMPAALRPVPTVVISDRQAEASYDAARQAYASGGVGSDGVAVGAGLVRAEVGGPEATPEVVVLQDPSKRLIDGPHGRGKGADNIDLPDIHVVVDVENTSLRDVFAQIISQAAAYTGPWTVKWRLKPENMTLLDDRVNLTAEAKFGDFVQLLGERVRNMSGVQLFVTTFRESRVILVTDTYY